MSAAANAMSEQQKGAAIRGRPVLLPAAYSATPLNCVAKRPATTA